MKVRFWTALVAMSLFLAGSAYAQEYDPGDDAIRRGCPGLMTCYLSCRNNYNNAIDSVDGSNGQDSVLIAKPMRRIN